MKRRFLFVVMLVVAGFTACKKNEVLQDGERPGGGNGITRGGCVIPPVNCTGWICTGHFAEVILEVNDATGSPVSVDSFVVTNLAGRPLPPAPGGFPVYGYLSTSGGRYTVINDGWVAGHQNTSLQVQAKGFKLGLLVFDEPFTIGADCCHVGKHAGKDAITIP